MFSEYNILHLHNKNTNKHNIMQANSEKINVLGKIKTLEVGESFELNRNDYSLMSIRNTASRYNQDNRNVFIAVNVLGEEKIKIERVK